MRRTGITYKLFIITAIFFILFISTTLLLQTVFFQKFYINKKTENFINASQKFAADFPKGNFDEENTLSLINTFDEKNNSNTVIFNVSNYVQNPKGVIVINGNNDLFFPIDNKRDAWVITLVLKEWMQNPKLYNTVVRDAKPVSYNSDFTGTRNIVHVAPLINDKKVEKVIFSAASLQPVGEAVTAMNEFYIYIYISAIILIIILSLVYSVMITKPLVKLKKTALSMAELDFKVKCEVKSKDEIGDLGQVLNYLSGRLDKTLTELKDANNKLKKDIEKEKKLEEMRKEFVAGVSHELKTPVSLINGYAEALRDNVVREGDREHFLDVILDESKKMGHLVKDMLDLSHLETPGYKLGKEEFDMVALVNMVLNKFSQGIQKKNVSVETNFAYGRIMVFGDIFRIEQVLVNFLSNAVRHVPDGGRIAVNLIVKDDRAVVEVENQGDHIPKDELDKIWEKFYKIDKSRNREAEGTGIGLAIAKNILVLHNSSYGVENTSDGVRFYFDIDRAG